MQLRLDAADRLVELVEEQRGPVLAEDAARRLFALRQAPVALARSLLADVVETDARLAWSGDAVALAEPLGAALLLEEATYGVVDLETTGLRPGESGICEIGAVRLRGFEVEAEFETLVDPGLPIGAGASAVTGLRTEQLRGHVARAIDNGVTKDEIVEVITHMAFYSGWPTAMSAASVAKDVLEKGETK